jgi:hypothetical protein
VNQTSFQYVLEEVGHWVVVRSTVLQAARGVSGPEYMMATTLQAPLAAVRPIAWYIAAQLLLTGLICWVGIVPAGVWAKALKM